MNAKITARKPLQSIMFLKEVNMPIRNYWILIQQRRWLVLGVGIIGLLFGLAYAFTFETPYRAVSSVYLQANVESNPALASQMTTYMENQTLTYAQLTDKPMLQEHVKEVVDFDVPTAHMTAVVSTNVAQGTYAIDIAALAEEAQMSVDIANATAAALVEHVAASEPQLEGEPILEMVVSAPASEVNSVLPGSPTRPAMGLLIGLLTGVALALLIPRKNNTSQNVT